MPNSVLHGRERELEALEGLVSQADKRGSALIVHGDAGVGKSALLAAATAAAPPGTLVLRATGVQTETRFPLAGIHQILRPVLDNAEALPARQRDALLAGFGATNADTPEFFLVALAAFDLLSATARDAPILLVVDDAQWLDAPSLDVLAFIARRVESEAITLLVAVRDGHGSPLLDVGLPELRLGPLAEDAAEAVVAARLPDMQPESRRRLLDAAAGNPLALEELATALATGALGDEAELPADLPLTPRLAEAFSSRSSLLPPTTQMLLLVAALADEGSPEEVLAAARAIDGAGVSSGDLDLAVSSGLAEVDDERVRFKQPLTRAAILQVAGATRRRDAQNALTGAPEPGRRDLGDWERALPALAPGLHAESVIEPKAAKARKANGAVGPGQRGDRLLEPNELAFDGSWHDTIEEKVYGELRELIVSLQLPPGTRLTQRGVADRLGVSQTPVRAAMGRLSREGLVTRKHGRATVTALTRELYQELLAARLGPERLIARLGTPLVTDADVAAMDAKLEQLRSLADRRNSRSYVKSRWHLHAICYEAAGRPRVHGRGGRHHRRGRWVQRSARRSTRRGPGPR